MYSFDGLRNIHGFMIQLQQLPEVAGIVCFPTANFGQTKNTVIIIIIWEGRRVLVSNCRFYLHNLSMRMFEFPAANGSE